MSECSANNYNFYSLYRFPSLQILSIRPKALVLVMVGFLPSLTGEESIGMGVALWWKFGRKVWNACSGGGCSSVLQQKSDLFYSQKRNCARISAHIFLQQNRHTSCEIYKSLTDTWTWKLLLRRRNSFSRNICFEFPILCLCSVRATVSFSCWYTALQRLSSLRSISSMACRVPMPSVWNYLVAFYRARSLRNNQETSVILLKDKASRIIPFSTHLFFGRTISLTLFVQLISAE